MIGSDIINQNALSDNSYLHLSEVKFYGPFPRCQKSSCSIPHKRLSRSQTIIMRLAILRRNVIVTGLGSMIKMINRHMLIIKLTYASSLIALIIYHLTALDNIMHRLSHVPQFINRITIQVL